MPMTRRHLLRLGAGVLALPWTAPVLAGPARLSQTDLLEEIERRAFRYFWEQASPRTGQVRDRARTTGREERRMSSIAATGFGLTGLCIAEARGYAPRPLLLERVRTTLRFLAHQMPHEHGFFYHFVDMETGQRWGGCELSSIDTALLVAGVLTCRQHFEADPEVAGLADEVFGRVDWPWMLDGGDTLSMGWTPESGFLEPRWDHYCELMILVLLGMASPTHPLPAECWQAWRRPWVHFHGLDYISGNPVLFTHQYSHAWVDFRGLRDQHADYFRNSVLATRAHRAFCLDLADRFPHYSEDMWGITASDSAQGYVAWGGPPADARIDGTVVPCAAGGSIPFLPDETLRVLQHLHRHHGRRIWGRYGFADAFNPATGWVNPDVLGIDLGITMLMAENHRTGLVWATFMRDSRIQEAMRLAGFRPA